MCMCMCTLLGHLASPLVGHTLLLEHSWLRAMAIPTMIRHALLLEHGCERTHNDYFADALAERGADASRYGWASLTLALTLP